MTQYVPAIEACELQIPQSSHTSSWIAGLERSHFINTSNRILFNMPGKLKVAEYIQNGHLK